MLYEVITNLQEHLMRIQQNVQNTVIIITHDVDEAVLLSDRVIMMTNGPERNNFV